MPNGIMIFQINAQKILFDNFMLKNIFKSQSSKNNDKNSNLHSNITNENIQIYDQIVK